MSKKLHVTFRGVVAFVPNRRFAVGDPKTVEVILRDLRTPMLLAEARSSRKIEIVDSHHAWLEFVEKRHNENELLESLATVTTRWPKNSETRNVLELSRKLITIKLDGQDLSGPNVKIVPPLLDHLATYEGPLKKDFRLKTSLDESVAAAVKLVGGQLSLAEESELEYQVPLHHNTGDETTDATVATAVCWTTEFENEVELQLRFSNKVKKLQFRPERDTLELGLVNRELDYLLSERLPPEGGEDDPEFLIYGEMIEKGRRRTLRRVPGLTPGGAKACGTGAIQPLPGG